MKFITVELNLGLEIFDFKLQLSQKSCFKILDCYYSNYYWDDSGKHIRASVYISAKEEEESELTLGQLAIEKIKRANAIMSFLYGFYFETHLEGYDSCRKVEKIEHQEYLPQKGNGERIKKFVRMYSDLSESDKKEFEQCCRLFSMAIYLVYKYDFHEDAILNYAKVMEMLSTDYWRTQITEQYNNDVKLQFQEMIGKYFYEDYSDSLHKRDLNIITKELTNMISLRRKMVKFAEDKDIRVTIDQNSNVKDFIKGIVNFRNDVAHGNMIYQPLQQQRDLSYCGLVLSLEFISKYYFDADYSKVGLNKTIK
ncbi:MAE_28990/MAE_18760 family HEPN-like nuclease [Anoxynatronum buryatiense]|uniref:Apea-like HEPN domain-containing protein n=1 Tax=Anoxynatronum buryatiense TaxID=489973 RepID=A0AA46AKM0_9CLOT|nr:MAE_28990/MAE_18760 family HEPN-like nuclease [Anoxynatronum buryatiense]SMP72282.1 hypothetical protein SAMN06296020_1278 [Anoxynatronum buryatiense]